MSLFIALTPVVAAVGAWFSGRNQLAKALGKTASLVKEAVFNSAHLRSEAFGSHHMCGLFCYL